MRSQTDPTNDFFELCQKGTVKQVKKAIALGADVNATNADDVTPLMLAASSNTPSVIRALIQAGAEINAEDSLCQTPLMFAAKANDRPEVIDVLVQAGAEVNAHDLFYQTALLAAIASNNTRKMIVALLKAGANPNQAAQGKTPLMLAISHNNRPSVIQALVDAGADPNAQDEFCQTPLKYAIDDCNFVVAESLIAAGAVISHSMRGKDNMTSFQERQKEIEAEIGELPKEVIEENRLSPKEMSIFKKLCPTNSAPLLFDADGALWLIDHQEQIAEFGKSTNPDGSLITRLCDLDVVLENIPENIKLLIRSTVPIPIEIINGKYKIKGSIKLSTKGQKEWKSKMLPGLDIKTGNINLDAYMADSERLPLKAHSTIRPGKDARIYLMRYAKELAALADGYDINQPSFVRIDVENGEPFDIDIPYQGDINGYIDSLRPEVINKKIKAGLKSLTKPSRRQKPSEE
jgi:hypothetical protein